MKLKTIAEIQSGHITRGRIEPRADGTYHLLQARDVDGESLSYEANAMIRFNPVKSEKDWILKPGDLLFMARGARNFTLLIKDLPDDVLAAACFFIIRIKNRQMMPEYLHWYLNQDPVAHYLHRHSGRSVHMPVVRRAVLESIHVPTPPLKTQKMVARTVELMDEEQALLQNLAKKRRALITATCLKTISKQRLMKDDK
ncbi:MAG: restriction endonuclease subunit S [Deltaproteobacteria bacterium]|nr:restriction endonuclease subunit S [Deltaproteobacteria bacterium]